MCRELDTQVRHANIFALELPASELQFIWKFLRSRIFACTGNAPKKKKENKKWRRDTKVGGDGGVFRSKAALYENGNGMGNKLGKSGRVTTHRWQSICRMPKVIRFESEIQNYSLTGTERAMPERFLKRSIFNFKTSRDPWESLVGKIASGPYLAHKRNENKIVWQLPAKRQNGKRCSAIASKLHISISNERQLAEKLLPMVAKKSAPNWKVQKVLEK